MLLQYTRKHYNVLLQNILLKKCFCTLHLHSLRIMWHRTCKTCLNLLQINYL
jgi:hypothetical protein